MAQRRWEHAKDSASRVRAAFEFFSRCCHSSKIAEGNVIRCGNPNCRKIVGFVRAPK